MKRIYKISALLMASMMLMSACSKKNNEIDAPVPGVLRVSSSNIEGLRTQGNAWEVGDAIGLFTYTSGEELSESSLYDNYSNIKFITKGGNGVFTHESNPIVLPKVNSVDVVAYYPYSADVKDFKYSFNNSDQSNHAKIDLLYANDAKELSSSKYNAEMTFKHQLTAIQVELNTNGVEVVNPVLTLKDVLVDGTMSIIDGSITTGATMDSPSITLTEKSAEGKMLGSMILPPQKYEGKMLTLKVDEKVFEAKIPTFTSLSGYRYVLTINYVKADGKVQLRVSGANISDWNEGETLPGVDVNDGEITVEVTQVTVTPETSTMKVGESMTLAYNVLPETATDKSITWASSNDAVATVENAVVKAIAAGSATITASSKNGKKGTCVVTVKADNPDKSIPDVPGENL